MFEDATFESTGRIHTGSRNWMVVTSGLNGSILLAMVLIPLIYPHALPQMTLPFKMEAPVGPVVEVKPVTHVEPVSHVQTDMQGSQLMAPRTIPRLPYIAELPETTTGNNAAIAPIDDGAGAGNIPFAGPSHRPVVTQQLAGPVRITGSIVEGLLLQKTIPHYPPIAVATRTEGTVVLQATISRIGTIENLRVISGSPMLQQAALDAVKSWRYRPYLLTGQPVEVETTVNVVFKLQN